MADRRDLDPDRRVMTPNGSGKIVFRYMGARGMRFVVDLDHYCGVAGKTTKSFYSHELTLLRK